MYDTSSWFQVQLENPASEPVRKFSIGTSDYSDRVAKWPRIKRTMNDVKSLKVTMPVDNVDGHFNSFYEDVYTIPNTGTLQLGFESSDLHISKILDDCGDTSDIDDWEEYFDGLSPVDNQVYVKEGSHSMELGIDASLSGEDYGYWQNNQNQGDLSNYKHGWIYLWIYFSSIDYLEPTTTAFRYRIGSSTSAYLEFDTMKANLSVGWNLIECDLDNPDAIVGTIAWSTIAYQVIVFFASAGNTTDFAGYADSLRFLNNQEVVTLYTGFLKTVSYKKELCDLEFRDNLNDFQTKKVGDSNASVVFSSQIPSDIGWDLCTCYGGLSSVASTNNPDIDYTSFLAWKASFIADNVLVEAQYDGMKVTQAINNLAKMTDSAIWVEGDGKINFLRPEEPSSLDLTFTRDHFHDIEIDVESLRVINKAWVYWNYAVESDYFQSKVFAIDSASINTYTLQEEIFKDESVWYVNSVSALVHAQRKTTVFRDPPKRFTIDTNLYGMRHQLGETVRLVDSFYNVSSSAGWRLIENELNMETGEVTFEMDEAAMLNGFYLDTSLLDGDEVLL